MSQSAFLAINILIWQTHSVICLHPALVKSEIKISGRQRFWNENKLLEVISCWKALWCCEKTTFLRGLASCSPSVDVTVPCWPVCLTFSAPTLSVNGVRSLSQFEFLFFYSPFLFLSVLHGNLYWAVHNHRPSGRCGERWACSLSDDQTHRGRKLHGSTVTPLMLTKRHVCIHHTFSRTYSRTHSWALLEFIEQKIT